MCMSSFHSCRGVTIHSNNDTMHIMIHGRSFRAMQRLEKDVIIKDKKKPVSVQW